ncbi:hypothetical protein C8_217 [Cannes 8 virus]|uniref:Uncharacterized protein n=1 Tax=Marseillevirus marseillevirus TaxID=694581 RepID=D2XAL1_GBMV|nr:hypothetical protein MAR_ORF209 [Marseillevirus marseillevirus]YP_009094688.1 conserved putative secreted protein [Melbournevirus]AGV01566.1 hypothetical protein C8_217 [Cannes 8 virus]AVR52924.1 hypothetical protein MarSH_219 [Marseillevirus Shanghai 1]ADB03988.1 hypothetical protein MAR_ORF209 [Marseillevirus marseillevirus]AIT54800.1 hypothetical protein MEL_187 [Melbournevirus]
MELFVKFFLCLVGWIGRTTPRFIKEYAYWSLQKKSTAKVTRRLTKVKCWISGQKYHILLKHKRGPFNMLGDIVCDGKDCSLRMSKYLGPNNDFFGQPVTPKDLGYTKVSIEVVFPKRKLLEFEEDEVICLS